MANARWKMIAAVVRGANLGVVKLMILYIEREEEKKRVEFEPPTFGSREKRDAIAPKRLVNCCHDYGLLILMDKE